MSEPTFEDMKQAESTIKTLHRRFICCSVSGLCLLIFALVIPIVLTSLFTQAVKDGITLNEENQQLWARFPGKTNLFISRNYSFYRPTNLYRSVFLDQKPQVREVKGFIFQQKQDYINRQYSPDKDIVSFDFYQHFHTLEYSRPLSQDVQVLNIAPLGFWHTVKNSDPSLFALQGLASLIFQLQQTFLDTIVTSAVSLQFYPDFSSVKAQLSRFGFNQEDIFTLWQDPLYGLSPEGNLQTWIQACSDQQTFYYLLDFFQLQKLPMKRFIDDLTQNVRSLAELLQGHYFSDQENADNAQLVAMQWALSNVTNDPPQIGNVVKSLTICDSNQTCSGYPQIFSFQKYILKDSRLADVVFTPQIVRSLFQHGSPEFPLKAESTLFHIGNMQALFGNGTLFQQGSQQALQNIKLRFKLPSSDHAQVLWRWMKYFTFEFLGKQSQKNNFRYLTLGSVGSQALYQAFSTASIRIHTALLTAKVRAKLSKKGFKSCADILSNFTSIPSQLYIEVCRSVEDDSAFMQFLDICRLQKPEQWRALRNKGIALNQLINLCQLGLGDPIDQAQIQLSSTYACSNAQSCNAYELGVKQWINSTITLQKIQEINFIQTTSVHDWWNDIPAFQIYHFKSQFFPKAELPEFGKAYSIMDFDHLFSAPVLAETFTNSTLISTLGFKDPEFFKNYLRFIVLNVGFGGLTVKRPAQDFLFGYQDQFLANIKNMDPAAGGDPSIDNLIHLNELNLTEKDKNPQEFYTGAGNIDDTRYYKSVDGLDYTALRVKQWTGNETIEVIKNPFKVKDHFIGSDTFQAKPDQYSKENLTFYITNIYRWGTGKFNGTKMFSGVKMNVYTVNDSIILDSKTIPGNDIYYQYQTGFFNFTSIMGAPIFVSKSHFLNCSQRWINSIGFFNQDKSASLYSSYADDSFIYVQPNSGTSVGAGISLQANYLLQNDQLFPTNLTAMIPVYWIFRQGIFTDQTVDDLFTPLKVYLVLKPTIWPVLLVLGIVLLGLGAYWFYKKRKLQGQVQREHPLLYSLQENSGN